MKFVGNVHSHDQQEKVLVLMSFWNSISGFRRS
jgi:hypothetical protein